MASDRALHYVKHPTSHKVCSLSDTHSSVWQLHHLEHFLLEICIILSSVKRHSKWNMSPINRMKQIEH